MLNIFELYQPEKYKDYEDYYRCIVTSKPRKCTPEEIVRQSMLQWLIKNKKVPRENIKLEQHLPILGNKDRVDIAVFNNPEKIGYPEYIIECKQQGLLKDFTKNEKDQLLDYAKALQPKEAILTKGDCHACYQKNLDGVYERTGRSLLFGKNYKWEKLQFLNSSIKNDIFRYIKHYCLSPHLVRRGFLLEQYFQNCPEMYYPIRTLFYFLYGKKTPFPISFKHFGCNIVKDQGLDYLKFTSQSGYGDAALYRLYRIKIDGQEVVVTAGIQFYFGRPFLHIGFIKPLRTHCALQIDIEKHSIFTKNSIQFVHPGSMARVKHNMVFDEIRNSGRQDMLQIINGKTKIVFGPPLILPFEISELQTVFANIFYYAFIRSKLRDSLSEKSRKFKE